MRILFLSTWFPYPPDNGSKVRVYHLLQALGRPHKVTLLAFAFGTADPDHVEPYATYCQQVQVVRTDPHRPSRLAWTLRFFSREPVSTQSVPAMRRLAREVEDQQDFDVVIASTKGMSSYALQLTHPAIHILEEHNSSTRQMKERYRRQTSLVGKLRCWVSWQKARKFEQCIFQGFDLITMVSEADKQSSQVLLGGKRVPVEVLPNGVDCVHNRPGLAETRPCTLIYNGALTYSANYDAMYWFLAQVYPLIRQQISEVTLTITGSNAGVNLSGLQLDDSVHLIGYVEDIRLPVAQSAICVVPLRRGGGTRLKILEAMALGTPVVATPKGAEGLNVVDGKHLLIADDPATFAEHTVCLLQDPTLRQQLSINARQLVEQHYDWAQIGQQFLRLVEQIVDEREGSIL